MNRLKHGISQSNNGQLVSYVSNKLDSQAMIQENLVAYNFIKFVSVSTY